MISQKSKRPFIRSLRVVPDRCTACGLCLEACFIEGAIYLEAGRVKIRNSLCVNCESCVRQCPPKFNAIEFDEGLEKEYGKAVCTNCPIYCQIPEGRFGACYHYVNHKGRITHGRKLLVPRRKRLRPGRMGREEILKVPLVTGIGAGTTPSHQPAPCIVSERVDGVDVVTVASYAPLDYARLNVKIDADRVVGREGARVKSKRKTIGLLVATDYGSQTLSLGGIERVTGVGRYISVKVMQDIINRKPVELEIEGGSHLVIAVGDPPVIDGQKVELMKYGCGGATVCLIRAVFRRQLREKAGLDEVIALDREITALVTATGKGRSHKPSGIIPVGKKDMQRFFGAPGDGWGGTVVHSAAEAVSAIDTGIAKPGMKILVTETTGKRAGLLDVTPSFEVKEIEIDAKARKVVDLIAGNCQLARVSAMAIFCIGGSARHGVTGRPVKLTEAVHGGLVTVTIGSAPVWLYPGGGINVACDVEDIPPGGVGCLPTPCLIVPIEYTMELGVYKAMGGHLRHIRRLKEVLKERDFEEI